MTDGKARGRRGFAVFTLVMVALFVSLGVWQLQRRLAKHALIAALTERLAAAPVPLPVRPWSRALRPRARARASRRSCLDSHHR